MQSVSIPICRVSLGQCEVSPHTNFDGLLAMQSVSMLNHERFLGTTKRPLAKALWPCTVSPCPYSGLFVAV